MPFRPTPSQEKYFNVVEGCITKVTDEKDDPLPLFVALQTNTGTRRELYSLFSDDGNLISTEDCHRIPDRFCDAAETYGFDTPGVVRGIQELIQRVHSSIDANLIQSMQRLINGFMGNRVAREGKAWDSPLTAPAFDLEDRSAKIISDSIILLEQLKERMSDCGRIFEEHGIVENVPLVILQIEACIKILSNMHVRKEDDTYVCTILPEITVPFTEEQRTVRITEFELHHCMAKVAQHGDYPFSKKDRDLLIQCMEKTNVCVAFGKMDRDILGDSVHDANLCEGFVRALYLQHIGIDKYLQYFQLLAVLFEYAAACNKQDEKRYGSMPALLTCEDGLTFTLKKLVHAQRAQNPLFVPKHPDTVKRREELWEALANIGYLRWKNRDNGRSYRWKEGLSRMELIAQLDKMETPQDFYLEILASYDRHAFNPFREITIDSRNRIIVLTGANSNGKSTLMRSIAVALNTAMTGRKIQAEEAEMSLCDGIFHDFNVHNNVRKGVSRFRAQVRRVMAFLKDGTPHSLGLFDEMFHGTSSLYLLSLAWATLEEFSKRNLRAIVSTHESLLTFCTQSGGLEHLRGTYARQKKIVGGDTGGGIDGVTAMSLRNHFELRPGPVMDSDALRVAQEEGMPEGTLQRADSIKNMLMGEPDFTE